MAATLALVGVAPAYAGNSQAPGALKKVTTTETQAPAAAPAPVAQPAPAPQVDTTSSPTAPVKAKGNEPVNKGTAKKVVQQAPAPAPVAGAGTTTTRHRVRSRTNRTAASPTIRHRSGTAGTRHHGAPVAA